MSTPEPSRRRSAGHPPVGGDAGMSLVEVLVAMALTTVTMAIFTTGIVTLYRVSNFTEAREVAQSQVRTAFVRMDREIRYAAGLTTPGQVGADWYAEYVTTNMGPAVCGQLRLNAATSQLQWRTWIRGQTPPTTWRVLASQVSSTTPFTLYEANSYGGVQQLRLRLTATVGADSAAATKEIDTRFTARNTSLQTQKIKPADECMVRG